MFYCDFCGQGRRKKSAELLPEVGKEMDFFPPFLSQMGLFLPFINGQKS